MVKTQPLPEPIRQWLNQDRCISDDILNTMQVSYTEKYAGFPWVVLPILDQQGVAIGQKLRTPPDSKAKDKYKNPKGSKAGLYGLPFLQPSQKRVVLCEGEMDVLALLSQGIEAVCSTAGAGTFKNAWLEYFHENIEVVLCYDTDEAGQKGQAKVAALMQKERPDISLLHIKLPTDLPSGADITDFIQRCIGNSIDVEAAIEQLIEVYSFEDKEEPKQSALQFSVANTQKPNKEISFEEWQQVIKEHFSDLSMAAEACLSVVCQLLVTDVTNCFALVLVDDPSSGKTITINFFDDIDSITYSSDTFTPASFVSNSASKSKEALKEIDLLPRIRRKMMLVRDMATIFSARDDDLLKNMGILTRVLDGEGLSTDTGVHGRRALTGDYVFMLLAASTPIPLRVWKVMGALGQRLFFLSMNTKTKSEDALVQQLRSSSYKRKEKLCKQATADLLRTVWNQHKDGIEWDSEKDDEKTLKIIARSALLLCRLRGQVVVYRDKWGDEDKDLGYTKPQIEKPDRVNQLLYNYCRGHAVAMNRTYVTEDDIPLLLRLALDSAPGQRAPLFQELLRKGGEMRTGDVESFLKCSNPTALKEMKTLTILGLCTEEDKEFEAQKCIKLHEDLNWFLSDEFKDYFSTQGQKQLDL